MGDVGLWEDGSWRWRLEWRRQWFMWELPMVEALMEDFGRVTLLQNENDKVLWKSGSTGVLSVKLAYQTVSFNSSIVENLCYKHLWKL